MHTKTITELNGFRAFAVLLVVFFHYNIYIKFIPGYNNLIIKGGVIGVALFFILSGFLMTYPLLIRASENKPFMSIKEFYNARLFRIIPLYLFTMLLFFCFRSHLHGNARLPASFSFIGFLKALFFFNDSLIDLNTVVWTLKIELIFYLIFPFLGYLVFILYKKNNLILLGAILLLLLVIPLLVRYSGKIAPKSFYCNFDSLVMGIIVAIVYSYKNYISKSPFLWPLMLALGLATMVYSLSISDAMEKTLVTISLGIIVTSSLFWDFVYYKKILSSMTLGYIALISYSLYLWHYNIYFNVAQPLAKLLPYSSKMVYNIYVILIAFSVTFCLSLFTYYTIEKPFLKLKKWI